MEQGESNSLENWTRFGLELLCEHNLGCSYCWTHTLRESEYTQIESWFVIVKLVYCYAIRYQWMGEIYPYQHKYTLKVIAITPPQVVKVLLELHMFHWVYLHVSNSIIQIYMASVNYANFRRSLPHNPMNLLDVFIPFDFGIKSVCYSGFHVVIRHN